MTKTSIYNLGNKFGWHGSPSIEARPKHPMHALLQRVTYLGGDVYTAKYGGTPLTKEQVLEDQFAIEGKWNNPPSLVMEALYAERVTLGVSYDGMSESLEIRRGYSRTISDGDADAEPTIDDKATRFFAPGATDIDDYLEATPNISIWTSHHHTFLGNAISKGGVYSKRQLAGGTRFEQNQSSLGTDVPEYLVDTGVPLGSGTYSLRFAGYIGATSSEVIVELREESLYIAKHSVWILPFYVSANNKVYSSIDVIEDAEYLSMMAGPYAEDISTVVQEEYDTFYEDNPDEEYIAQPNGSGFSVSGSIYYTTPQTLITYDDPSPVVTYEDMIKMPVFLPGEVV